MADILTSIGGKVIDLLKEPVGRQFCYVIHAKKYIENLRSQVEEIEALRNGVQESIHPAIRNREVTRKDVKLWIEKVDVFIGDARKFLEECGTNVNKKCFNGCFPDLATRHRLGKEATEKTVRAKELQEGGHFNSVSNPAPLLGIESIPCGSFVNYEATNLAMGNVMEVLSDDKINFIGIHGIGGVGKTTLVKEIGKKAIVDKLFDEIVMAVVSQNPDIEKIQDQIAGMLGLSLTEPRVSKLCGRLKDVKRILIILDDVWAKLDLVTVGIPFGTDHQGCKVIITTRREQVCNSMAMEMERTKIVRLDLLSEQDSWDLFKKNAGNVVDSPTLNATAKNICKECGGLPIALAAVGSAMKGKYDPEEWKEAAQELRKSAPTNIEGVDQQVYKSLKLSYDYLQDEEAKACFLLCSLFPEDHNISIEDLVRYGFGLRIFKNVDTVQEARGRAHSVTKNLKASCLLLASDKRGCVKMHDVVRDVAISIGSNEYFVRAGCGLENWPNVDSLDQYTGISLMRNQISDLPHAWEWPNLQILLLQGNLIEWSRFFEFFSGKKALKVLDFSHNPRRGLLSMPVPFHHLRCLQTLILEGMEIENTTFLGQMKTLEVLSLQRSSLSEVPNAITELTNLRLLDLSYVRCHEFLFPSNVLSPLSHLEELYLYNLDGSVVEVDALRSLPRLKILSISIVDITRIPEDFVFPELESFVICTGKYCWMDYLTPNYLGLDKLDGPMIRWRKCLKMLLKRASYLEVRYLQDIKNIFPDLSAGIDGALNVLKSLSISSCHKLEYLICYTTTEEEEWVGTTSPQAQPPPDHQQVMLHKLEELTLFNLGSFKGISSCQGALTPRWGWCLRTMTVFSCGKLKYVFQPSIAQALQQLERLSVVSCKQLEEIVANQNEQREERGDKMEFKSLKSIELRDLPNLSGFCTSIGNFSFEWPSLERLTVAGCPKMKTFAAGVQSTPKLKEIEFSFYQTIKVRGGMEDLSQFLQNRFKAKIIVEKLSEEEIRSLKATFTSMDTDKSGFITYKKLKTKLSTGLGSKLPVAEVNKLMEAAHVDGNGAVDCIEYINATMHTCKLESVYEGFRNLHGDGLITRDELETVLKEHKMDDVLSKIPKYSVLQDGRIWYYDFCYEKMRRATEQQ